jgi:hypothetical protein
MKAIKYLFILAASAFIFNSCTKQVAGPAGPNGAQGAQGAASSYYIYVDSVPASGPTTWKVDAAINGYSFTMTNISGLTNPNTSVVEVYYSTSLNTLSAVWYPIPVASTLNANDFMEYWYEAYTVQVQYIFTSPPVQKIYFKVVVITNP